ncbi:MAG: hypothetical protein GC157_14570 [Frankiales bacterium]|nr:hypothetical protein [Frankiales bacterium]
MKIRSKAVAGALALATAGALALVGASPASAAATSPFDPSGNGATQGTITFYDSTGAPITHGPLATPPAYAVADTYSGRPGDTLASLFAVTPQSTAPPSSWPSEQISASDAYPATLPGALAGNTHAAVSSTFLWFDPATGHPFYYPNNDANTAWQGLYQLRMFTSGPGQSIDVTQYASATIAVDQVAGEWTQVYPAPVYGTSVTTPVASVASPAAHGTSITLSATATAADSTHPAGTIQFKDNGAALGAPVAVDSSGAATSASFVPTDGNHLYTAVFTPTSTSYTASAESAALSFDVTPAATVSGVDLGVDVVSGPAYQPVTLTATLTTTPPGSVVSGTVTFKDNGVTIGSKSAAPYSITLSTFAAGAHSFTAVFGSGTSAVTSAAVSATYDAPSCTTCTDPQTIQVTVAAGTLTISTPWGPSNPFDLGTMQLSADGKRLTASGDFGRVASAADGVTITDTRAGDQPWTASVTANDFSDGTNAINSANLSFDAVVANYYSGNALNAATKPIVVNDVPTHTVDGYAVGDTASLGDGLNGGPHQFASAVHGTGTVGVGGTMNLVAPTSTVAGTYQATVTFTIA